LKELLIDIRIVKRAIRVIVEGILFVVRIKKASVENHKLLHCSFSLIKAVLKLNVDVCTLLIFATSARLLREKRVTGDPTCVYAEEAPEPPAESECLQRKSTVQLNRA
jgi:hypothetical protein